MSMRESQSLRNPCLPAGRRIPRLPKNLFGGQAKSAMESEDHCFLDGFDNLFRIIDQLKNI